MNDHWTDIADVAGERDRLRRQLDEALAVINEISMLDIIATGPAGEWNIDTLGQQWWVDDDSIDDFGVWLVAQARQRAVERLQANGRGA